jgi:hypothetical protein
MLFSISNAASIRNSSFQTTSRRPPPGRMRQTFLGVRLMSDSLFRFVR